MPLIIGVGAGGSIVLLGLVAFLVASRSTYASRKKTPTLSKKTSSFLRALSKGSMRPPGEYTGPGGLEHKQLVVAPMDMNQKLAADV